MERIGSIGHVCRLPLEDARVGSLRQMAVWYPSGLVVLCADREGSDVAKASFLPLAGRLIGKVERLNVPLEVVEASRFTESSQ